MGRMQVVAAANWTNASMPAHVDVWTTPVGSVTPARVARFTASKRFKLGGTSFGTVSGTLHVEQESTTGNIPAVVVEQKDTDLPFLELKGTSVASDFTRSFVDEDDSPTPTLLGYWKVGLDDTRGTGITAPNGVVPVYGLV